jgi:hypothetical protein
MNPNSNITITTTNTTNEEVTLTTSTSDIQALRDQIDALSQVVKNLAERASTVTNDDDEATVNVEATGDDESHEDEATVSVTELTYDSGDADEHGFVTATVGMLRPDAPVAPEPEVAETPDYVAQASDGSTINAAGIDPDFRPEMANGVRPSDNTAIYSQRGRYPERRANLMIINALAAQAKWVVANSWHPSIVGCVIHAKRDLAASLSDWIPVTNGLIMTSAQIRTALNRLVAENSVMITGKRGKQHVYQINPTGKYSTYLTN